MTESTTSPSVWLLYTYLDRARGLADARVEEFDCFDCGALGSCWTVGEYPTQAEAEAAAQTYLEECQAAGLARGHYWSHTF